MRHRHRFSLLGLFGLTLLSLMLLTTPNAHAQQASAQGLFKDAGAGPQALQAQGANRLRTLESDSTSGTVRLVRIADRLSQQVLLTVQLDADEGLAPSAPVVHRSEDPETNAFEGSGQTELFLRRDAVKVYSDDTYAWRGTVLAGSATPVGDSRDNVVGNATFVYRRGGHVTGTIRIEDEYYTVRPLDGGLHALVQINESKSPRGGPSPLNSGGGQAPAEVPAPRQAPQPAASASTPGVSPQKSCAPGTLDPEAPGTDPLATAALQANVSPATTTSNCGSDSNVDVLVVYTDAADNGRDIDNLITLAIDEANQSYSNSDIYFDLVLAHSQQVGFDEGFDIAQDLDDIQDNSEIQSLRNEHDADVVVLLTAEVYGNTLGRADEIRAEAPDGYAIAVAPHAIAPDYTFVHEIGHLQGGQHHPARAANPGGPLDEENDFFSYAFGHRFSDRDCWPFWPFGCDRDYYSTIMAYPFDTSFPPQDYPTVGHFSDPDIGHGGEDTGQGDRDNARALRATASTVANFRTSNELVASITVTNSDITTGEYAFETDPCGGNGSYSYEWRVSYNEPFNYGGVVSTAQSYSNFFPPARTT